MPHKDVRASMLRSSSAQYTHYLEMVLPFNTDGLRFLLLIFLDRFSCDVSGS